MEKQQHKQQKDTHTQVVIVLLIFNGHIVQIYEWLMLHPQVG